MVLESVEPLGVRTVPLSKYLTDYDSRGNPYPGGLILARHQEFQAKAKAKELARFGQFAVDLFGYPYNKDEIAKIAARIMASHIPFSAKDKKALTPDREYICPEYAYECYKFHRPCNRLRPARLRRPGGLCPHPGGFAGGGAAGEKVGQG
jgi:hypothetical protein